MAAQAPQVAALADGLDRRLGYLVIFGGFAIGIVAAGIGQQPVEFTVVEAGQREIILNIAKQRNGTFEGKVGLWFSAETFQYRSAHDHRDGRKYLPSDLENAA